MPNITDIANIAEALEKSPVVVVRDRCVAVRNRNASCRACVGACPVGAIEVSANEIRLDASACMACGGCAAICPTEALVPVQPPDSQLARAAAESTAANGGCAVLACARISSKRLADPSRYAEVPCLARVEETLLLTLVSHGADRIVLVDGTCATCKHRGCVPLIDASVTFAGVLLAAQGSKANIVRASAFPGEVLVDDAAGLFGSTRRSFLADTYGMARETAMTAARATIEQELGIGAADPAIGERLRVGDRGVMPQVPMPRHDALINAMDAIGAPAVPVVQSRRFGRVQIDVAACNACGMCAVFCPTGAIRKEESPTDAAGGMRLEFQASDCVQCGLCADVCWKGALAVSPEVPADQLFDFEPRVFDVAPATRHGKGGL